MSDPVVPAVGATLNGKYRLVRPLGRGGVGEVFEAEHLRLQTLVAVKVLLPDALRDAEMRARFEREARALGRVTSRHVVRVLDVDQTADGVPFVVMELLRGRDLRAYLKDVTLLPPVEAAEIVREAALGLAEVHRHGILHRDLKPGNLFLAEEPEGRAIKIVDFGVSKILDDVEHDQTHASVSVGTPAYMSPEQLLTPRAIDRRADLYSLGAILYRLLSGRMMYDSALGPIPVQVVTTDPPPLQSVAPETPAALVEIVSRCLARDPGDRFVDAGALVAALEDFLAVHAPPPTSRTSSRTGFSGAAYSVRNDGRPSLRAPSLAPPAPRPVVEPVGRDRTLPSGQLPPPSTAEPSPSVGRLVAILAVASVVLCGSVTFLVLRGRRSASASAPIAAASASAAPPGASIAAAGRCPAGMVYVPGGAFVMGNATAMALPTEKPTHKVVLDPYCIDRTEVTVADWRRLSATGDVPRAPTMVQWTGVTPRDHKAYDETCNGDSAGRDQHPINCVDWAGADAFCRASRKRLPTSAEWELAAHGPEGKAYPWGDEEPDQSRANTCDRQCAEWEQSHGVVPATLHAGDDGFATTAPVGRFPAGASRFGVDDLVGNVMEWTSDWDGVYTADDQTNPTGPASGTERVVRGGGWNAPTNLWARPSYRFKYPPETRSYALGFRCAVTP